MIKRFWMAILTILCSIGITIAVSYAWFLHDDNVDPIAQGYSGSAYFAYGDGINTPYGINTPRHLYNLAWLCYLVPEYASRKYEIDPNLIDDPQANGVLNMTGWVLPPIGTEDNPFLGAFNGNGVIISNLTTSNNFTEDIKNVAHPSSVTSISGCNNMGFFGNIGPTSGTASDSNKVYNFYLRDNIVKTATSATGTYFGAAAGYVNATMENVGVISGTLNNASSNTISEYSVVGHSTETYLTALNKKSTIIYNPTTTNQNKYTYQGKGTATGWGGSIDMLSMYNTLKTEWNTIVNTNGGEGAITYPTAITTSYSNTGVATNTITNSPYFQTKSSNSTSVPTNYIYTSSYTPSGWNSSNYIRFYDVSKSVTIGGTSYKTSSYSLLIENPSDAQDNNGIEWRFMCLTGYADRQVQNALTYTYTYPNAYYLTDGTNYLTYNSETTLKNVTSTTTASKWYYDNTTGYYWTFSEYGTSAQTKYYLTDNTNYPILSTSPITTWTFSNNSLKSNNNHYLVYDEEDGWVLKDTSSTTINGFTIRSGEYYLATNGTNINTSGVSEANATVWFVNSSNQIYSYVGTTEYYLRSTGNNRANIQLGTGTTYRFARNSSNKISRTGNSTYYLRYNDNTWSVGTNNSYNTFTFDPASMDFTFKLNRTSVTNTTSSNQNSHFTTPNTYFPLQATNGVPDDKNTGYVVSGANFFNNPYGDIRVSAYGITDYLNGAGGKNLTKVYTLDSSKQQQTIVDQNQDIDNSNDYVRFKSAYKSMKKVLSDSDTTGSIDEETGYVYGLHFMDATIGLTTQNQEVRIPYAKINGEEYFNYQVPYDCIDFNLKDKGYITFFAGSYYTNNKSFFSLYEIYREDNNPNNIAAIAEIEEIYSNPNNPDSYVYKLTVNGGTKYSVPFKYQTSDGQYVYDANNRKIKVKLDNSPYSHSLSDLLSTPPSGYTKTEFKTQSIKPKQTLTSNACYYFEIPVNDGEYCLGSVPGSDGAYLMYLDIGANATEVYRSEITQKTTITTETFKYPSGVAIIEEGDSIVPRNSAVAKITSTGQHSISVSGTTVTTITITGASSSSYINPDVILSNGSTSVNASGTDPSVSTISQLMIVDYVKSDSISTYVTLITAETGKNRTSEYYLLEGNGVLDGWGLFKTPANELDAISYTTDASEFQINTSSSNPSKEQHYYYATPTSSNSTVLKMVANGGVEQDDGKYYSCAGDNIYITTDETIKLYVTQKETLIYKFFFNLDMENYPYPSNQTGVPVQTINEDENYEYVFS